MHGLGNDFIVIENMNNRIELLPEHIALLCDRHVGIGADGLILIEPSTAADCFMNYYNQNGEEAEMCGNGIRCTARFLKEGILKSKNEFEIETRIGVKRVSLTKENNFSVNMGKPLFESKDFPDDSKEIEGKKFGFVSMGNPHAVCFVSDLEKENIKDIGPKVENSTLFPNKINVELVEEKSKNKFKMKVWERGCGETLACGTGACAVYARALRDKGAEKNVEIELPGGILFMTENNDGSIIMSGPASTVYTGVIEI